MQILSVDTSSTTSLNADLQPQILTSLKTFHKAHFMEESSLLRPTETIITSSTIAVTTVANVVAVASTSMQDGSIVGLFGQETSQSIIGSIPLYISKREKEKLFTMRSTVKTGYQIVKLEIFPYLQIVNKKNRIGENTRLIGVSFIWIAPIALQVHKLQQMINHQVNSMNPTKEVLEQNS